LPELLVGQQELQRRPQRGGDEVGRAEPRRRFGAEVERVALLGLRRGEAAGLRWCDIDLDARVLQVSHQVQDHNGRTVICPPKTESSVRVLALDSISVSALRSLRAERRRRLPAGAVLTGFLFVNQYGNPTSPGYLTHAFRRLIAEADLPPIRLHDLRHGAASLSLAAGNDLRVVQAMLGTRASC
jgi:integrase